MANHGADIALTGEADGSADEPVFFACAVARILQRVFDTLAAHHGAYAGDHLHGVFRIRATRAESLHALHPPHTSILKKGNEVYFERASDLTALQVEDLMVRMNARLLRLMSKDSPGALLALATQLKREDGDLQWWRARIVEMRNLPTHSIENPS